MRIEEKINNAIGALDYQARRTQSSAGVQRAIRDLADAWRKYWESGERALTPDVLLGSKLERFVAWYTRGWALVNAQARSALPHPRSLAPEFADLVDQSLAQYLDSARDVAADAARLSAAVVRPATAVLDRLTIVLAAGLVAYVVFATR